MGGVIYMWMGIGIEPVVGFFVAKQVLKYKSQTWGWQPQLSILGFPNDSSAWKFEKILKIQTCQIYPNLPLCLSLRSPSHGYDPWVGSPGHRFALRPGACCHMGISLRNQRWLARSFGKNKTMWQGLVNVHFWGYWTSPYSSHKKDHIPNGWVMFNGDI